MMIPINVVADILKQALDFTNNVVSKFDDEKYASAVMKIYGHEPDYSELDTLSKAIETATDISIKEKSELLMAVADKRSELREKEIEYKKECAKVVNKGFEKKCKFALKLALGVMSGGISLLPDLYHLVTSSSEDRLIIESESK